MIFRRNRKPPRKDLLSDLAPSLGLSYSEKDSQSVLPLLLDFRLFKIGGAKKIRNLMWKNEDDIDLRTRIFDYHYTVSTGNSSQTFKQTVFFFYSKGLGLPQFKLQPERFIHRVGAWLGFEDLDFESHEEFSREHHLKGEDKELVRATFSEPVLDYFTFNKGWTVEGLNYFLIIYQQRKKLPPAEIGNHFLTAKEIYSVLKHEGFNV